MFYSQQDYSTRSEGSCESLEERNQDGQSDEQVVKPTAGRLQTAEGKSRKDLE